MQNAIYNALDEAQKSYLNIATHITDTNAGVSTAVNST